MFHCSLWLSKFVFWCVLRCTRRLLPSMMTLSGLRPTTSGRSRWYSKKLALRRLSTRSKNEMSNTSRNSQALSGCRGCRHPISGDVPCGRFDQRCRLIRPLVTCSCSSGMIERKFRVVIWQAVCFALQWSPAAAILHPLVVAAKAGAHAVLQAILAARLATTNHVDAVFSDKKPNMPV